MIKYTLTAVLLASSLGLSSCSTTGGVDAGKVLNSPTVQAILTDIASFAIKFAENYVTTHVKATRNGAHSDGVMELEAQIIAKYHVSDQLAETEALAAFGRVK